MAHRAKSLWGQCSALQQSRAAPGSEQCGAWQCWLPPWVRENTGVNFFFFCVPCCGHLWLCGHICLCLLNTTLSNGAALASALRQHLSLFISVMISALQDRAHSLQDSWKRGEVRVCFPPRASSPHVCLLVCLRVPALVKDL